MEIIFLSSKGNNNSGYVCDCGFLNPVMYDAVINIAEIEVFYCCCCFFLLELSCQESAKRGTDTERKGISLSHFPD